MAEIQDKTKLKLWQIKNPIGRPPKFKTPEDMWEAAVEYFKWADDNPIQMIEKKAAHKRLTQKGDELKKAEFGQATPRPYTITSFCAHAGIRKKWADFSKEYSAKSERFREVVHAIENIIQSNQMEGAIANLYNQNIVARLNGLSENVNSQITGKDGQAIQTKVVLDDVIAALKASD